MIERSKTTERKYTHVGLTLIFMGIFFLKTSNSKTSFERLVEGLNGDGELKKSPVKVTRKASQLLYVVVWSRWRVEASGCVHKPCLASEADTWSASVESCGESAMLMLPEELTVLSWWGESSKETISAPWSVRALALSRKLSLWLSIGVLNLYEWVRQDGGGGS